MRTTIDIDPDVLQAAKEISRKTRRSAGKVISELARAALSSSTPLPRGKVKTVQGFEVMPAHGRVVTPELIEKLMEDSELE